MKIYFITLVVALNMMGCSQRFGVKRSIGVEKRMILPLWQKRISRLKNAQIIVVDIRNVSLSDATVVLFWFNDEQLQIK